MTEHERRPAVYEVGQPYIPGRTTWPERGEYNYRMHTHELRLFFSGLTAYEVNAIAKGPCSFALVVEQPVILLLYQFGGAVPWSDAPFSVHMVPEDQRTLPPPLGPRERATLQVILVEATSGIVKTLRVVSFSPEFSRRLHQAITEQAAQPFDQAAFDTALAGIYLRYPRTNQLLKLARIRTMGGV